MGKGERGNPATNLVTIEVLPDARADLITGFRFYEQQATGLGRYFLDSLFGDIETIRIRAVLRFRREPSWIRMKLRDRTCQITYINRAFSVVWV